MKKRIANILAFLVLLILGYILWLEHDELTLDREYEFTSVNSAFFGKDGKYYVVDRGREAICVLNSDMVMVRMLQGGEYERFYYAEAVAEDQDGIIYIADEAYDAEGEQKYRIVCLEGKNYRELYSTYGQKIYEMQEYNGGIYFLREESYGLSLYRIDPQNGAHLIRSYYTGDVLNGASVDLTTGVVAIAARRGDVRILPENETTWQTLQKDAEHLMPQDVSARNGYVYFTDLYQQRVCRFAQKDLTHTDNICAEEDVKYVFLNASLDAARVLCSDYSCFYHISCGENDAVSVQYITSAKYLYFWKTILLWFIATLFLALAGWLLRFVPGLVSKILKKESSLRMLVVVTAVVLVSCFVAWSLLSDTFKKEDEEDISGMKLFTDMVLNNLDTGLLNHIEWEYDYRGSSYMKMNEELNGFMERAYEDGRDYYYVLYDVKDGELRYLMNYYDSCTCGEPYNMDAKYYLDAFENGTSYALKSRDADGFWLYVVSPVTDAHGENIAVIEIGTDLSYRQRARRDRTIENLLAIFCSAAVMMMLIVEALFLLTFMEHRRDNKGKKMLPANSIPLRTVAMLSYGASTLQDAFITTLSAKMYPEGFLLPAGIAAGLPLAAELLMMALFAVVGGRMTEKLGTRKTLFVGVVIEISGFVVCAIMGNYFGLLIGNTLIGIGMGIINVTGNVLAAMGDNLEDTSGAFADIMAGSASGITIGAGLASLLYPIGGSRLCYTVAACFMVPVILLVYMGIDVKTKDKEKDTEGKTGEDFRRFFFNLRVLGFLALILVPFMVSISYREYFLPMYVTENGISEHRVGQIFMICGLLVLYVGPYISKYMIRKFGTFWSIIIAGIAMGLNMFLFVIYPSVITAVAGILILSAITSFAYTCQYTFFEELPDCGLYGDGRSMGVYSIFENFGQTIGPLVYGALLGFGYRVGLAVMGAILLLLVLLYAFLMKIKGMSRLFY